MGCLPRSGHEWQRIKPMANTSTISASFLTHAAITHEARAQNCTELEVRYTVEQ